MKPFSLVLLPLLSLSIARAREPAAEPSALQQAEATYQKEAFALMEADLKAYLEALKRLQRMDINQSEPRIESEIALVEKALADKKPPRFEKASTPHVRSERGG